MNEEKYTQRDEVVRYMTIHGSITSKEAMEELGIGRLASRINDLRRQGYAITTDRVTVKTRYGTANIAQYRFTNDERSKEE